MYFPTSFLRITGTPSATLLPQATQVPALGSDASPLSIWGANGVRPAPLPINWPYSVAIPAGAMDNVLTARMKNKDGHPVRRIACSFLGPTGAIAQLVDLYLWEESTRQWYQLTQANGVAQHMMLLPGGISYVDVPCLSEPVQSQQQAGWTPRNATSQAGDAGDLLVMLVPGPATGQPNNSVFQFGMGACVGTSRAQ